MMSHKKGDPHLLEMLYNRKHKRVQSAIENAFGITKKTFHELQGKKKCTLIFFSIRSPIVACRITY